MTAAHTAAERHLTALVRAVVDVAADPAARRYLAEVLESTADGTGTVVEDLQHMVTLALAHCKRDIMAGEGREIACTVCGDTVATCEPIGDPADFVCDDCGLRGDA